VEQKALALAHNKEDALARQLYLSRPGCAELSRPDFLPLAAVCLVPLSECSDVGVL